MFGRKKKKIMIAGVDWRKQEEAWKWAKELENEPLRRDSEDQWFGDPKYRIHRGSYSREKKTTGEKPS